MANEYLDNKSFETIIKSFQQFKRLKERNRMIVADYEIAHSRRQSVYADDAKLEAFLSAKKDLTESEAVFNAYQDQLASAFYILSQNIANYTKFNGVDIDDAVQEGVMTCFDKIDRFDPRKGKAFNYMTTCILNHFRHMYRTARNYVDFKYRYQKDLEIRFDSLLCTNKRRPTRLKSQQN